MSLNCSCEINQLFDSHIIRLNNLIVLDLSRFHGVSEKSDLLNWGILSVL